MGLVEPRLLSLCNRFQALDDYIRRSGKSAHGYTLCLSLLPCVCCLDRCHVGQAACSLVRKVAAAHIAANPSTPVLGSSYAE